MLRAALFIALLVSCNAQTGPPTGSLIQFAGLASGWQDLSAWGGPSLGINFELLQTLMAVAKSVFGIAVDAVESKLDSAGSLARALPAAGVGFAAGVAVGKATSGMHHPKNPGPPSLPPLPRGHKLAPWASKHEVLIGLLADKWSGALVKAQFSPGLQGFLSLLHLQDEQEALIKWLCIIYPWDALVPDTLRDIRDSYCSKALPAAAVSRLLGSGPPKGPGLAGPGFGGPGLGGPGGIMG